MERKSKLSLSLTLTVMAMLLFLSFTGNVYAPQFGPPIGAPDWTQKESFDSNPTTGTYTGVGTMSPTGGFPGNVMDGDAENTNANWYYGGGVDGVQGYVAVSAFKKPSDNGLTNFAITWIDIKVSYKAAGGITSDDQYRIVANVSDTRVVLVDWVSGVAGTALYDPGTGALGHRTFSKVTEPINGEWTWTDLANLEIIFECLRVGTNNYQRVYLYEVWVTAYATPFPANNTISVQPNVIIGIPVDGLFYLDVYVTSVNNLWGYQFMLTYDPAVLTCMDWMSYGPFVLALPSEIGVGYVSVSYGTYSGDPNGFNPAPAPPWHTPVCRLWFMVTSAVKTPLTFDPDKTLITSSFAQEIPATEVGGYYYPTVPEFPLGLGIVMLLIPAIPVVYLWRLRKKERA